MIAASHTTTIEPEAGHATAAQADIACFHCGEPCNSSPIVQDTKSFCCNGCQIVHNLLSETGLGHFYDLAQHPGVRVRHPSPQDQWSYLDDPTTQRRLLDFADNTVARVTFQIPTIHCVACVWLLENLFQLNPAIGRSRVNFPRREATITFAPDRIKLSEIVALLASIGYEPLLTFDDLERPARRSDRRRQWLQIGIAGFAFGNIMLFTLPLYLGLDSLSGPMFRTVFGLISLLLAAPVLVYSAMDYWRSAWLALRQRVLTLDVPIALGLAALYGQSAFEIISGHGEGYLDSLSGLIFFLLCGRIFQQKTHDRLAFDRDYKSFFPLSITRIPSQSAIPNPQSAMEERIALSDLQVGDRVLVRNGELLPADAELISGPARIDYSFVTGESEPVRKETGDYLYAGGKQIGAAIEVRTVKPVSQSYLTSLWNNEAFNKNKDDDLNTLTNRYSRRFTGIVVAVACGSALLWTLAGDSTRGFKAFTSVLIVACPCALALAAPFTLGTAQRLLARAKMFVKNTLVIERLARADAIVFDKTGTLTAAGTHTISFHPALATHPLSTEESRWIASLALHSTHPYSMRLAHRLSNRQHPAPIIGFHETTGCGIEGRAAHHTILLGSAAWLQSRGVHLKPSAPASVQVAIDGQHRGGFAFASDVRPDADRLLRRLNDRYDLALLSGDNERERVQFRELFGNDARLNFNQTPVEKLGFIRRLQSDGRTVVMVGDGLNDAGALKQSDVGVAVIENAGAFSPASDVIIEASQVPQLADMLTLARRSERIVRLSFGISAAYNLIGISIAAAGILSPLICAVLMPLSSISVVLFACSATSWSAPAAIRKDER